MEDMDISVKDLIRRILLKWRGLLVWMFIFGVLLTVFGGVQSYREVQNAQLLYDQQAAAGGPAEGETWVVVPQVQWFSVSKLVMGVLVGAVVVCIVVLVRYLMAANLRVKEDMKEAFGVTLLGAVCDKEAHDKKNKVDALIEQFFYPQKEGFSQDAQIDMICTDIKLAMKKANMKNIFLTGACDDAQAEEWKVLLAGKLDHVDCGKSVVYNPQSLETLVESDGVVLVERVDASAYVDIQKELEFCERYEIPVIGCIVIE